MSWEIHDCCLQHNKYKSLWRPQLSLWILYFSSKWHRDLFLFQPFPLTVLPCPVTKCCCCSFVLPKRAQYEASTQAFSVFQAVPSTLNLFTCHCCLLTSFRWCPDLQFLFFFSCPNLKTSQLCETNWRMFPWLTIILYPLISLSIAFTWLVCLIWVMILWVLFKWRTYSPNSTDS